MKVTDEGQVTIPVDIRERFRLMPGTEVEFVPHGHEVTIRPARNGGVKCEGGTRFQRWLEGARGSAIVQLTTDEILAATRGEG